MLSQTNARIKSGGEQPQLYDTRILATRNASPGWAYNCDSMSGMFSSSTLPTLYNDMMSKFSNREDTSEEAVVTVVDIDALEGQIYNITGSIAGTYLCLSKTFDLIAYAENWEYIDPNITDIKWRVPCNSNTFICGDTNYIYKGNKSSYDIIADVNQDNIDLGGNSFAYYDTAEVMRKVFSGIPEVTEGNGVCLINSMDYDRSNTEIYVTNDIKGQGSEGLTKYSFTGANNIMDFEYVNGYWYILTDSSNYNKGFCIYKGTNLSNSDFTNTANWTLVYEADNNFFDNDINIDKVKKIQFCYYNNKFYIFCITETTVNDVFRIYCRYSSSNFLNISDTHGIVLNGHYYGYTMRFTNNYILIQTHNKIYYCSLDSIANSNSWGNKSIDVTTAMSQLSYSNEYNMMYVHDSGNGLDSNKKVFQVQINPNAAMHTDKYIINGTTININYYIYNYFKMCTYDNLSILSSLYYEYGVSDYWNIIDGQILIPMNKQQYSVMYVGDNYINS